MNFTELAETKNAVKSMIYSVLFSFERVLAERTLPISNLKPLNELTNIGLKETLSPYKISPKTNVNIPGSLRSDLIAINEFLIYVKAEPFITPEKAKNFKRVAFKNLKVTRVSS